MGYNFISCDRGQQFLMPPSLNEWLPKDHLARFVVEMVDMLDLSAFYARRRADGWGRAAYDPKMMVALLIYAYATGTRSSRKIEARLVEDVAFRFIAANETPDHATVARFAKDHEDELADLFHQVLRLAAEVGLVKVGLVALDSTRIKADASPGANHGMDWIRKEVDKILKEARAIDDEEDRRAGGSGDDIPEELIEPDSRLARLVAAKARLDEDAARRQAAYEAKLAAREEHKARTGKGMTGRKPKPPDERLRDKERSKKSNTTDPDSRILSSANGGYLQGFTGQAIATEDQITIACGVTNESTDFAQLKPMIEQAAGNLRNAGVGEAVAIVAADAGYLSDDNLGLEADLEVELLIATKSRKQAANNGERSRGRIPNGQTRTQLMERKLKTKRGEHLYRKRAASIEPVFGQQRQRGMGTFRRRGLKACDCEWRFEHAVHNLLKMRTSVRGRLVRESRTMRCSSRHPPIASAFRCLGSH
ncbi:MAG: transposase [Actinobacteria bacterium]|nr:transposase [Actinomycetota bacterium]